MYIADLHTHSHYAQACSKFLTLETLYQWARIKGIQVISTGDFTHPAWFQELQNKLEPDGNGFFRLKNPPTERDMIASPDIPWLAEARLKSTDVRFCLSTEISSIYLWRPAAKKSQPGLCTGFFFFCRLDQ